MDPHSPIDGIPGERPEVLFGASRHTFAGPVEVSRHLRLDSGDELLAARIHRSLIDTGRRPLAELKITVAQGRVRMSGSVPSYYAKQLAHQAALTIEGIQGIDCEIDVG